MTAKTELEIEGMHCDGCETTVGAALSRAGLTEVRVDWRRGTATGLPSAGFTIESAAEQVAATGYKLVEAPAEDARPVAATDEYDLVIIGSGSGAFAAAIKARELGARVAMVERDLVGGTCVNIGCVPSKALLRAAELFWKAGHSPFAGVETTATNVDLRSLVAQKNAIVAKLRKEKYEDLLTHYEIDLIRGSATFVGRDTVAVAGRSLKGFRFLIATGAAPWVPPIEGIDTIDYLTSTSALELEAVPGELIVVGANAIGLELGQLFVHLGSKVTFVEALERVAPFEEPEISAAIDTHLRSQGAVIHTGASITRAGVADGRVWLDIGSRDGAVRLEADRVLMATGRRARTADLGLDLAGVETDPRGQVMVNDSLQSSNDRIYAVGDVTNHPQFVYVAALGGNIAAENAIRGTSRKIDFTTMPRVTFTTPAIASVGLTEEQAREAGKKVITSVLPIDVVPRAIVDHETGGLVKLVADETSGQLLGAHIIADGAGDVIQAAVMALKYRATIEEIASTYHPYLTMAEALKLAAQGFNKDISMLSCCAA
ncbi:MAG: mercury(II) reductase [Acidimicrobiia bacterium]